MLVIGYGNTLRSDDGAGQIVAEEVEKRGWEGVGTISVHQLTPELAEEIAQARGVIFVDAIASEMEKIQVIELKYEIDNVGAGLGKNYDTKKQLSHQNPPSWGHTGNPRSLLFLTQTLYHKTPPAWWVLIPGVNFELGEQLSPVTQRCIKEAVFDIERLIRSSQRWV